MKKLLSVILCLVTLCAFVGCGGDSHNHSSSEDEHNHEHIHTEVAATDGTVDVHTHEEYEVVETKKTVDVLYADKTVYSAPCGSPVHTVGSVGKVNIISEAEVHGEKWGQLESGEGWIKLEDEILPNILLVFADGFDDWRTQIILTSGGKFTGQYWDFDAVQTHVDYPNGTQYFSDFSGQFEDIAVKDEYTVMLTMNDVKLTDKIGTETVVDGTRKIVTEPLGVGDGTEFYLYSPGTPKNKLPKEVLTWWSKRGSEMGDTLEQYCLYNTTSGDSFFGKIG